MRRGCKALVAVALAAVALALAPSGAVAAAGTVYGGATSQDDPVGLIVSKDHRRIVRLLAYVDLRCSDGSAAFWSGSTTFSGRGRVSPSGHVDVRNALITLAGRLAGATARGTVSVSQSFTDKSTGAQATCASGRVTWRTRSARGSVFAGLSSAGGPIVVELAEDRLSVRRMRYGWKANCQAGGFLTFGDSFGDFPLGPRGGFGTSFLLDPMPLEGGSHRNVEYDIHGRVAKTQASGTFSLTATETDATGAITDTCATGRETWRAVT